MYFSALTIGAFAAALPAVQACDSCYGPTDFVKHERMVRRMQPTAQNASYGPSRDLDWGQINFLHTTDTHGWLEGHIKEENYGADWGDFVSFTRVMKNKASKLGVDLLLIDTGDLHDGNGDSDVTSPNGLLSNPIFENIEYDLLTIGNHELYVTDIAYETFSNFSQYYGDRYLTSNVQIINPSTGEYEYIGSQYRYFSTENGLRIMAFGVLFDFTGNSNVSKVTKAADLVQEAWFKEAVNYTKPIDLFVVIGHNPIRETASTSTFGTLYDAIRTARPDVPLQAFGGHTHIRDFYVYDSMTTGLESGRYCETLGWLSMTGINSTTYTGNSLPSGVSLPSTPAVKNATATASAGLSVYTNGTSSSSGLLYSRRYLDWNRATFAYHAEGSQDTTFDVDKGISVTEDLTELRTASNLTSLYGCAPQTWCQSCKPFDTDGNIFNLLKTALAATIINDTRADVPRLIIINTGSIRFDLAEGPFTLDDSFIVSPFDDSFEFIPDVPYSIASQVLAILNAGAYEKRSVIASDYDYAPFNGSPELCLDPTIGLISDSDSHSHSHSTSELKSRSTRNTIRRDTLVPGYTTTDDFGSDGDDTAHSEIAYYSQPNDLQANASFPTNGSLPDTVDLIFLDYIGEDYVIPALTSLGANYTLDDIIYYLPEEFTTNDYLPAYAKIAPDWQANVPNCPVGKGIGFTKR